MQQSPRPGEPAARPHRRRSALVELTLARSREFVREPEALFWSFGFPLVMAVALGVAFLPRAPAPARVAIEDGPGAEWIARALADNPLVAAERCDARACRDRLRIGRVQLTIEGEGEGGAAGPGATLVYHYDEVRPESRLARALTDEALQRAAGRKDARPSRAIPSTERGTRYIDFLVPGLLGMTLMTDSLFGIGWPIVMARTRKLLKRLAATPMRRSHYLLAQMLGRLMLVGLEVGILLVAARLLFDVRVSGSLVDVALLSLFGAVAFSGVGLLVASRARSNEAFSGWMNLVSMPMYLLSGVFFASSHFPAVMQPLIRVLPLTALNDALRAVIIDGAGLFSQGRALAVLAAWGAISFVVALRWFRWS